jgi:hypothetical protein
VNVSPIREISVVLPCRAPAREVWKLLHDPVRFASWWPGWDRVEPADGGAVTRYDARWPDFAYPVSVSTDPQNARVVISCLLSDIVHSWFLEPHVQGCRVGVLVTIPEAETARAADIESTLHTAVASLVALAESRGAGERGRPLG